jgi:4-amino-4-deoxy-L-arabinose transferase-like glycosyltransferase
MSDYDPPRAKQSVDYTGPKIVAILAPVFFLFAFLGKADMGLTACIVLGMIILAIKIRWNLRKHVWFWATIIFVLALHIPLFFVVRWPQGKLPTLFYTMPLGIADFLIISGALWLAEKLLSKDSSRTHEQG